MPNFSMTSKEKLATCHPELQLLFNEVIKERDCTIIEGHRNQADQEKAFNAGNSKLHYPHGNHNAIPSNAVDVMAYPVIWNDMHGTVIFATYVLDIAKKLLEAGKMTHTIRWGGTWREDTAPPYANFFDGAHYELHNIGG